jgi:hypothetical protein
MCRGEKWAETVVRALLAKWPDWPTRTPKVVELATRHVMDLHGVSDEVQAYLVRICIDAARQHYLELKEFLAGRRLAVPSRPGGGR